MNSVLIPRCYPFQLHAVPYFLLSIVSAENIAVRYYVKSSNYTSDVSLMKHVNEAGVGKEYLPRPPASDWPKAMHAANRTVFVWSTIETDVGTRIIKIIMMILVMFVCFCFLFFVLLFLIVS